MNQPIPKSKFRVGQRLLLNVSGHHDNVPVKVVNKFYFKHTNSWYYYYQNLETGKVSIGAYDEMFFFKPNKD